MPILEGDIKIMASQVLADVPEGGGAATGTPIPDGVSNNLFPDVSELDRVYGRAALRKVFANVVTDSRDVYMGAHAIVADEPDDPAVSCLLFSTSDAFDTREQAQNRVESYLIQGAAYPGYLFGNHIAGQMAVSLLQRPGIPLPVVGSTIVLRKNEGLQTQVEQFVRIVKVSSSLRTFTDEAGDFDRVVVQLEISGQLKADYTGLAPRRSDHALDYTGKTRTYDTTVADAARYYGVKGLTAAAGQGDRVLFADGIFTALVPSTRTEVGIADARMNQQSATLVKAGDAYSRSLNTTFTTSQALFVGGGILPGSLSVARGGVTLTDSGGVLLTTAAEQVGTVDYANGVLNLATNVFGGSPGTHAVQYTPAAAPTLVNTSRSTAVTQASQRLTWNMTIDPPPARGSLQVSYRTFGRWYVLQENGQGEIRGSDPTAGAGMLNYATGTISLTLGALPDVGSAIVYTFAETQTARPITQLSPNGPALGRRLGVPVSIGAAIKPGTLSVTWNDGAVRTATDSGGTLTGDATGSINYASGTVDFRPNVLPAKGTPVTLTTTESATVTQHVANFVPSGDSWTGTLPAPIKPGTLEVNVLGDYLPSDRWDVTGVTTSVRMFDDGLGKLMFANGATNTQGGTVDYATGAVTVLKVFPSFSVNIPTLGHRSGSFWQGGSTYAVSPQSSVVLNVRNGPGANPISPPVWAWWSGQQANALEARYCGNDGSGISYPFAVDELFLPANANGFSTVPRGYSARFTSFFIGSTLYSLRESDGVWQRDVSPSSGVGVAAGSRAVIGGLSGASITSWPAGASSAPTGIAGATQPELTGAASQLTVEAASFRTSVSPLQNGGFDIAGRWADSDTPFTATADATGVILSGSAVVGETPGSKGVFGRVDYEMGLVKIQFGRRVPASMAGQPFVVDMSEFGIAGLRYVEVAFVQADTLRYNAAAYTYLPLEADKLGLDPVRLPSDGRVPVFRRGSVVVVHHTADTAPATVTNGQTVNLGRVNVATVRVIGNNGATISSGYTLDRAAGTVTFTSVAGYSQPVTIRHRIEEAALLADAQVNGLLRINRPLSRAYPSGSKVSSALLVGDMFARVSSLFDQATWNSSSPVWSDELQGSAAGPTFDTINYPAVVQNRGAVTERWALVFTGSTTFAIVGEHLGQIGTGNTATDCAPLNPATGTPYFILDRRGFNSGWSAGNVVRLNTVGASAPLWVVRVVQQGQATLQSDSFTMAVRGDIDTP